MSLATDIENDFLLIDGVESVTLTPKRRTVSPLTGVKALQRQLTRSDLQLIGDALTLDSEWAVWHVWNSRGTGSTRVLANTGAEPRLGDWLTSAAGVTWIVQSLTYSPQTTRWRLICQRAR